MNAILSRLQRRVRHTLDDVNDVLGYPAAPLADSVLDAREQAFVAAVSDAFFPRRGPIPLSGSEAGVLRYFDGYMRRSAPTQRFLMRLLLLFLELSPMAFGPRFERFSRLTQDEQIAALADASTSRIYFRRVCFVSMRALMTMAYLANDTVVNHMHMHADPDPFGTGGTVYEDIDFSCSAAEAARAA